MNPREAARNQAGIFQITDTNSEIDVFRDQVDLAIVQIDIDPDFGMLRHKSADRFRQQIDAKSKRQSQAYIARDLALRVGQGVFGFIEIAQNLPGPLIKFATGLGQSLPPGGPLQQLHAQPTFEIADASADFRFGRADFIGGSTEAVVIDYRNKCLELFKTIHIVPLFVTVISIFTYLLKLWNKDNNSNLNFKRVNPMSKSINVLRLDASANPAESSSKKLGDALLEQLERQNARVDLRTRDLNRELSFIDSQWVGANFTAAEQRDSSQLERLAFSDELISELQWADHIVLTTPMYNFSVPATLKAWIDLVCRAGVTFRYSENGPVGLLEGKSVDIVVTTGGVPLGSPVDFVSGYLRQVMNIIVI